MTGALKREEPPNSPLFWFVCGCAHTAARHFGAKRMEAVLERTLQCVRGGGHFSDEWLAALKRDLEHEVARLALPTAAQNVVVTESVILLHHIQGNLSARRLASGEPMG